MMPKDEGVNVLKKDGNRQFLLKIPLFLARRKKYSLDWKFRLTNIHSGRIIIDTHTHHTHTHTQTLIRKTLWGKWRDGRKKKNIVIATN